jgi:hypothetical protein
MASILKVDELRGIASAGDITVTSEGGAATQSLQQGLAKAWVQLIGTGTVSTLDSFNNSSISDLSQGRYQTNFSNSMNNDDYAVTASDTFQTSGYYSSTTSSHNIFCNGAVSTPVDSTVSATVHGDLA